ncbi:hypothetical protein [Nocardioides sp. SYSU D00065]|uniref:hypothetical protein n=1 Tax=Nocardioides sp. SYSU D00065 TaxID=2817378 RepID=UPI001B331590|nr:hypothetical protein [Nocardioides sp. SYSU D00065]
MHLLGRVAATATALLLAPLLPHPAPAGAALADLQPEAVARGADLARPYLEGETVVDGERRVDVAARHVELVAPARGGYVVTTGLAQARALFVAHDGSHRRLPGADGRTAVSADGRHYTEAYLLSDGVTKVAVRRISDGRRLASRVFSDVGRFAEPIDLEGGRVLIGSGGGRVMVWHWRRDRLRVVVHDERHVQVGTLTGDVYAAYDAAGERCTVVARLERPGRNLWRSCTEKVLTVSDDGRRIVTIDRRVEPTYEAVRELTARTVTGRVIGRWSAAGFADVRWEAGSVLTFRLIGATHTAMVRCTAAGCETASDPRPLG